MKAALLLTGALLLVAGAGFADHGCNGVITAIGVPGGPTVYVDDRSDGVEVDHWVYLESNGVAGLQSGGSSAILGSQDADTNCAHPDPDTLIV